MLKELNNIRSFHDLQKVFDSVETSIHEDIDTLSNVSQSFESDSGVIVLGDKVPGKPPKEEGWDFNNGKPKKATKTKSAPRVIIKHEDYDITTLPTGDSMDSLVDYSECINRMYCNIDNITIAREIAKTQFRTLTKTSDFVKSCDALIAEANAAIGKAFDEIATIAKKHVPTKLKKMFMTVYGYLFGKEPKIQATQYTSLAKPIQVVPIKVGNSINEILFSAGITLRDFKLSPDKSLGETVKNFKFRVFSIALTAKINIADGKIAYYITAYPDFKLPGTYAVGKQITEDTVIEALGKLLSNYNFKITQRSPFVTDKSKGNPFKSIYGVKNAKIIHDKLAVMLEANLTKTNIGSAKTSIIMMLQKQYNELFRVSFDDSRTVKLTNRSTGEVEEHTMIYYTLIPVIDNDTKKRAVTSEQFRELTDALQLSHKQQFELKKILWND